MFTNYKSAQLYMLRTEGSGCSCKSTIKILRARATVVFPEALNHKSN